MQADRKMIILILNRCYYLSWFAIIRGVIDLLSGLLLSLFPLFYLFFVSSSFYFSSHPLSTPLFHHHFLTLIFFAFAPLSPIRFFKFSLPCVRILFSLTGSRRVVCIYYILLGRLTVSFLFFSAEKRQPRLRRPMAPNPFYNGARRTVGPASF